VLAHGLLDTLCSRGSDALIDHECLLQVVQALAGVAFLEVAEADAFKGTRFNKGTPMSRPCARTCQPGRAMALTACTMAQNGRLAHHAHRRRMHRLIQHVSLRVCDRPSNRYAAIFCIFPDLGPG